MSSPACGPSASATATARLSSTTGKSVRRVSSPYRAAIWAQSPRLVGVERRDGGLHDVGTAAVQGESPVQHGPAVDDLGGVQERVVLLGEQHEITVAEPSLAPGVEQLHEREETVHLRLVRHELGEGPSELDRLDRQRAAAAVALVEDQVDDREHCAEPVGRQVVGRHPERDPGRLDFALRPNQPLSQRRFGDQERARDLVGRQPAECPQRECHLRIDGERRMTAGEDELQAFLRKGRRAHAVLRGLGRLELTEIRRERAIPAAATDGPVARRRHEPTTRIGWEPRASSSSGWWQTRRAGSGEIKT